MKALQIYTNAINNMKKNILSLAFFAVFSLGFFGIVSEAQADVTNCAAYSDGSTKAACSSCLPGYYLASSSSCTTCTTATCCTGMGSTAVWDSTNLTCVVTASADQNKLSEVMCNVYKIATGKAGKIFAAFVVISVGIGFFTGKVSWGLMIGVAAGIATMFGGPTIVAAISGGSATVC